MLYIQEMLTKERAKKEVDFNRLTVKNQSEPRIITVRPDPLVVVPSARRGYISPGKMKCGFGGEEIFILNDLKQRTYL
jgi:hypothetical protein